jgi:hypothetical protein
MRRALALVVLLAGGGVVWACGADRSGDSSSGADGGVDGGAPPDGESSDAGEGRDGGPKPPPAPTKLSTDAFAFGPLVRLTTIPGTTELAVAADSPDASGPCLLRLSRNAPSSAVRVGADGRCRFVAATGVDDGLVFTRVGTGTDLVTSTKKTGFTDADTGGTVIGLGVTAVPPRVYFATSGADCSVAWISRDSGGAPTPAKTFAGTTCHDLAAGREYVATANGNGHVGVLNAPQEDVNVHGRPASVAVDQDDGVFFISSKPSIAAIPEGPALAPAGAGADRLGVHLPDIMWIEPDGIHAVPKTGGAPRLAAKDTEVLAFTADEDAIYYVAHGAVWRVARK